ncbi:hypothetical protein AB0N20_24835 [Streptomyces griseoincarnatus]
MFALLAFTALSAAPVRVIAVVVKLLSVVLRGDARTGVWGCCGGAPAW